MSTDLPKDTAGSEREAPPDTPALSELQQAILARARETIARRDAKPPRSRTQLLVVLAMTVALAAVAFAGLNYVVGTARRLIAEYAASAKEVPKPPAPPASEDPGVIIIQPDRTLEDPKAPQAAPPAKSQGGK